MDTDDEKKTWEDLENRRSALKKRKTANMEQFRQMLREQRVILEETTKLLDETLQALSDRDHSYESVVELNDSLESELSEVQSEIADAARDVIVLSEKALGSENAITEKIEVFELRRALEDLQDLL